jgi:hypothetical protein
MISNGNSTPVNKTAALVMSKGFNYKSNKKIQTIESENHLPSRPANSKDLINKSFIDCTGMKVGRLTVIGIYLLGKGWVCRCDCSVKCVRKQKSILNKNNTQERCEECRHLAFLKRDEIWRRTGKNADIKSF